MKVSIKSILQYLDEKEQKYEYVGDPELTVSSFSSLKNYRQDTITWLKNGGSFPDNLNLDSISLIVLAEEVDMEFKNALHVDNPKRVFFELIEHFFDTNRVPSFKIGEGTYLSPGVKIGQNVVIGHNCVLDGDIEIGDNTRIWNGVIIVNKVKIGTNCEIQSGTVIGHDDFAYSEDGDGRKTMIKHYGGVIIGNEVFISQNSCINRGTIDDTTIEDGCKIDAMAQISHNCHLEKNVALAFPCRLGGSVLVKENAYLASCVVRNQITVGKNAVVGMGAVVVKDVDDGTTVVGNPAKLFIKKESEL